MTLRALLKSGKFTLDSSDVKDIGEMFYRYKWRESNGSNSLSGFQKLILNVRCRSALGLEPGLFEGIFELRPPTDPTHRPHVALLEPDPPADFEDVLSRRIGGFFA